MSIRWMVAAASLAVVALTGCGGSVCQRVEAAEKSLEEKGKACESTTTSISKSCEANISKCTADDQKKIDEMVTCLEKVPSCVKGEELGWLAQAAACSAKIENISAECKKAFE